MDYNLLKQGNHLVRCGHKRLKQRNKLLQRDHYLLKKGNDLVQGGGRSLLKSGTISLQFTKVRELIVLKFTKTRE